MASQRQPASRKSFAHLPSAEANALLEGKENTVADIPISALVNDTTVPGTALTRKSRSKSLGPGGLDALNEGTGNRRKVSGIPPKSILKPSLPLSPLKEIPAHKPVTPERKTGSPPKSPSKSPSKSPFKSPSKSDSKGSTGATQNSTPFGPDVSPSKKGLSPEHTRALKSPVANQDATVNQLDFALPSVAEDDEGKQARQREREAIQKQREARRKSMANRRVSFAPEATLHTWDNIEDMQDSTTSSASTDLTRRASNISPRARLRSPKISKSNGERPNTPPEQVEDESVHESPVHQRDLHQKKRRRKSSGIPPMNFNNPEDALSSSPGSAASGADDDTVTGDVIAENEYPGSESDAETTQDLSKEMDIEQGNGEFTSKSVQDGEDDMSMDIVADEITSVFQPLAQQFAKAQGSKRKSVASRDQENVRTLTTNNKDRQSQSLQMAPEQDSANDTGEISMDITRAVGGIVRLSSTNAAKSVDGKPSYRGEGVRTRRRSSAGSSGSGDGTMDFTAAVGGIRSEADDTMDEANVDQNEELSMEFTSVFGEIQGQNKRKSAAYLNEHFSGNHFGNEPQQPGARRMTGNLEVEREMDMTTAIDGILQTPAVASAVDTKLAIDPGTTPAREHAVAATVSETESSLKKDEKEKSPVRSNKTPLSRPIFSTSETGSPNVSSARVASKPRQNEVMEVVSTPIKDPGTPPKQVTPLPGRPTTPGKTPPMKNVAMRHPSPKKLFEDEIQQTKTSPAPFSSKIFDRDASSGRSRPSIVFPANSGTGRRFSGVGFDKDGLGSPQVAKLLDRRTSINDQADVFRPEKFESRGVHFQDPKALEIEVLKDREEDERRESAQFIMENEAGAELEEKDATTTLKEAIGSMTPKKGKLNGRKSLAVGAAKGILGKRPAELDDEDEESTPMGIKGREVSPVKKIKLGVPPSASETTRRAAKPRFSLGVSTGNDRPFTPTHTSPLKRTSVTTPSHKGHFKDAEALPSAQKPLPVLGQSALSDGKDLAPEDGEERIRLQDFLNLTSIRFMELNTTKRRHAATPSTDKSRERGLNREGQDPSKDFENAVAAGACTLPMLELYQHSCRELKKYISEGRKVVREIETNTFEENPPLFREYMAAAPSDRNVMDNQFKNMKTHARFLSKGMWYEWRMKLLDGLKEVLISEAEGMKSDDEIFGGQEQILESILPSILEENAQLKRDHSELQTKADELANCDQHELSEAREQVSWLDEEIKQRKKRIVELQSRVQAANASIENVQDAKEEDLQAVREAQKMREYYRKWSVAEVSKLKVDVSALEAKHGWKITSASSTRITMVYKGQLQLCFDLSSFLPAASSLGSEDVHHTPISLTYIANSDAHWPVLLTTEKRFFLQLMQAHLQCVEQHHTHVKTLLHFVSSGWSDALAFSENVRRLDLESITSCSIVSDERLIINSAVLLPNVKTKVHLGFELYAAVRDMQMHAQIDTTAKVVYGEQYKEDKMRDFVRTRIGDGIGNGVGQWADAVRELRKKLAARGRKN